jgi:hypothetical protein
VAKKGSKKKMMPGDPRRSPMNIAREYLPKLTNEQLNDIIWSHTGFPYFWNIPADGKTPEACFRKQLRKVRADFRKWNKMTPEQKMEHHRKLKEKDLALKEKKGVGKEVQKRKVRKTGKRPIRRVV